MGFSRPDTLRAAGYTSGDFFGPFDNHVGATNSTTSNSYVTHSPDQGEHMLEWGVQFPNSTVQVFLIVGGNANGDELDYRVRNVADGETVVAEEPIITGSGNTLASGTPTTYTPTTTDSPVRMQMELRNNDNATSVSSFAASVYYLPLL